MKKFLLAAVLISSALSARAAVLRVNNTPGISAQYSNITTAINAAAAGDTIYVEGSATDYGYINVAKRLHIIGAGYFHSETPANPKTQANALPSSIAGVAFGLGSKGSTISGISMGSLQVSDSLITIQRNKIVSAVLFGVNNGVFADTFRNNYVSSYIGFNTNNACGNMMFYNNIFTYAYIIEVNAANINVVNGYFINNSFPTGGQTFKCVGFVFQNNIFGSPEFLGNMTSNSFFNNVAASNGIPAGNGNLRNQNNLTYYLAGTSTPASSDGRYQLQATSPAKNAGILNNTAVDCGAFGGPAPYQLSGMPSIPSIYSLTVPAQVSYGTSSINISLSAAAH